MVKLENKDWPEVSLEEHWGSDHTEDFKKHRQKQPDKSHEQVYESLKLESPNLPKVEPKETSSKQDPHHWHCSSGGQSVHGHPLRLGVLGRFVVSIGKQHMNRTVTVLFAGVLCGLKGCRIWFTKNED